MDLSLLNLKVGVIRKAERHPDADTLYVEEVDCGEEQPRTVVACTSCLGRLQSCALLPWPYVIPVGLCMFQGREAVMARGRQVSIPAEK